MSLVEVVEGKICKVRPNVWVVRSRCRVGRSRTSGDFSGHVVCMMSARSPSSGWRLANVFNTVAPSAHATLGLALVLLDSVLEFINFPLQQHFEQVGHLRPHHVTHCFEHLGHEVHECRGEMCIEGLVEHLYQVRPERLRQYIERQRLTARTGRRMLHGWCGLGGYAVAFPMGGPLWQRGRRSMGEGRGGLAP